MAYYPSDDSLSDPFDSGGSDSESGFSDKSLQAVNSEQLAWDNARQALSLGDVTALREYFEDGSIEVDSLVGGCWTALMFAVHVSQPDAVRYLLKKGADANRGIETTTPLICACSSPSPMDVSSAACVELLLKAGAEVNVADKFGHTPLMKAIETKKTLVVDILLPLADIEMKDYLGKTAVFYAVENNRLDVLKSLISQGAELNLIDRYSKKLKMYALELDNPELLDVIENELMETDSFEGKLDYENEYIKFSYQQVANWRDSFPGIFDSNKPAFWYEIPTILYGMGCEKLIPLFQKEKYDLYQFLSLTNEDVDNLDIEFPYLKSRLIHGLYKFHTRKWDSSTVSLKPNLEFSFESLLSTVGSHFKHIAVIHSTVNYVLKCAKNRLNHNTKKILDDINNELREINIELDNFTHPLNRINKINRSIPDLIRPDTGIKVKLKHQIMLAAIFGTLALCTINWCTK